MSTDNVAGQAQQQYDAVKSDPSGTPRAKPPPWRVLFTFTTRRDLCLLLVSAICSIIAGLANPAQAFITGKVFNGFIQLAAGTIPVEQFFDQQRMWVVYLVALGSASWVFHALEFASWTRFGERQAKHVRTQLYKSLSCRDISWYDTCEGGIEALLPRMQTQIRDLQLSTSQPLGGILSQVVTSLIALGQAFYNSWDLTLVTLAGTPIIVTTVVYFSIAMQVAIDKQHYHRGNAQSQAHESLSNVETVKCFNAQQFEINKYICALKESAQWYARIVLNNALQMSILAFLVQAMFVQAFYYGGILIKDGKKQPSQVITTFFSAITAFQAIQGIIPQMVVLEKGKYAGNRLRQAISSTDVASSITAPQIRSFGCEGQIELRSVSFAYPARPDRPALDKVNLTIPRGELTFIIGGSGSGKSTIGQLLTRFYEPIAGCILLDGIELSSLDIQWLRTHILLIEQSSVLFEGTVSSNVTIAERKDRIASSSILEEAIDFALLREMIYDMPDGLATQLGIAGSSLSGGQRQRIALARARVRDPSVLILDESTSALDQISRELVIEAIRRWRHGRTTIIITHDLTQILPDDRVVLLDTGKVAQSGDRKNLERVPGLRLSDIVQPARKFDVRGPRVVTQPSKSSIFSVRPTSFFAAASASLGRSYLLSNAANLLYQTRSLDERTQSQAMLEAAGHRVLVSRSGNTASRRRRRVPGVPSRQIAVEESALDDRPSISHMLTQEWEALDLMSRMLTIIGVVAGTCHAACSPVFAFVLAKLLNLYAQPESTSTQSLIYSISILGVALVDALSVYAYRVYLERSSQSYIDALRTRGMQALLKQSHDFFDIGRDTPSSLVSTLDEHAEEMRNLFGRFVIMLYIAAMIIIVALIWALTAQWKMTVLALTAAPYILVATRLYSAVVERWERQNTNARQRMDGIFDETFSKIRTIRALTLEEHFQTKFLSAQEKLDHVGFQRACWIGFCYGMSTSAAALATALVFYIGTRLAYDGANVAALLQVFTILILTISNVSTILDYVPQVGSAKEMAWRVLRLARLPSYEESIRQGTHINFIGDISMKQLTFSYPTRSGVTVLQGIDLSIKTGSTTALVGGSGSGKSTIAKLLLKLYPLPQHGGLKVSGRNIDAINTVSLRAITAVVAQTTPLFRASIADNITYGLPIDSRYRQNDNVLAACSSAGILDFINSLPDGLGTMIGTGNVGLSGGQSQRIAIARALVRQPSLLILDEATSALDSQSAALIRDTIRRLVKSHAAKMTILIITHSRDMMAIADDVIVLDHGRVVEQGRFEYLLHCDGHLARLLRGGTIEQG